MIYLITGVLGTGKTSMVVNMILDNYEGLFKMKANDGNEIERPLYFCHIDSLDKHKFKAHELTEQQIQEKHLHEIVPFGSVVLVDEADYTYPVRSAAREVPPYIKRLKEIRHDGITLILMTQHPTMIDKYIRNLVGKHIHLERKQIGTKRYEWLRCEENLNSQSFSQAAQSWYKPDKKAFKYYKSAEMHIAFEKKKHIAFYALPIFIFAFIWALFTAGNRIGWWGEKQPSVQNNAPVAASAVVGLPEMTTEPITTRSAASEPIGTKVEHYVPKVRNLPETKPIYDNIRQVKNMEKVAACVKQEKSCNCYTDQGTRLYVDDMVCKAYIEDGIFDRYSDLSQR